MTPQPEFLIPDWPAPANVRAAVSTRIGGVSAGPYASLNLGDHVGDEPAAVAENRAILRQVLGLPAEPAWLRQVHGTCSVDAATGAGCEADAVHAAAPGGVCAVLTADCLPVLFCRRDGSRVAAAHAGWRGLADGVLESVLAAFGSGPDEVLAWLGPAIGPDAFEVGEEVRQRFIDHDPRAVSAFKPSLAGRWLADLYALARLRLAQAGVEAVFGGGECTFHDTGRFFSYRRDGATGRMASLIWRES